MKKFRLPRKTKKKLDGHCWLYPADEKGGRLMAMPAKKEEDYKALKSGIVKDLLDRENAKAEKKAFKEKLDNPVEVTDEELRDFVNQLFAPRFRTSSYCTLIAAKSHPKAVIGYYNFVNAYLLSKTDKGYENICCLAVDKAKSLLKRGNK